MARPLSLGSGTHLPGGTGTTLASVPGSTILPDMGSPVDTLTGILVPDTLYLPTSWGVYDPFGGGLVRMPDGSVCVGLTVACGNNAYQFGITNGPAVSRFQINTNNTVWSALASGVTSFALTLTATGASGATVSKSLTVVGAVGAVVVPDSIFVDTIGYSEQMSATVTVSDAAGFFAVDDGALAATASVAPAALHYGRHDFTLSGTGGGVAQAMSVYLVQERAAIWNWTAAGTLYSNVIAGDPLGQLAVGSEAGIVSLAIIASDMPVSISPAGQLLAQGSQAVGTHSVTVLATSGSGKQTTIEFSYPVVAGTTLESSAISANLVSVDNSMTNGTLGTVTVAGMTSPTWSVDVANDEIQHDPTGNLAPRYALTSRGNVATITYTHLSAQTDELVLVAREGSVVCRATVPNAVAWKAGPTVTVGPSSTGTYDFPTWNAAMDAYWTNPATYAGMVIQLHPQDYSTDFNRTTIGHGSNQQYAPGPWKLVGVNPGGGRVLIDFKGNAPGLAAQGGIIFQDFDGWCENLEVTGVSNLLEGEGNAGAFYKTGGTYGNVNLKNCVARNSNMGLLGGWEGTHINVDTCAFYNCGTGAGGLVHNVYVGHASSVTATSCISLNTAQVHAFKSRAYRTTLTGCTFADGENGNPGASSNVDLPLGGIVSISGCTLTRGPNPNNDGNWIQFCTEGAPGAANGSCHPVNTLSVSNCTFQNVTPAGAITSLGRGVELFNSQGYGAFSPTTGLPPAVTVANCSFYNMPLATWWADFVSPPTHITDGGGNTATSTWTDIADTDPVYGGALPAPAPSYALNGNGGSAMMGDPLAPQIKVALGTAVGTVVARLTAYDDAGVELTNRTTTLSNTANGTFAVDPATGNISVSGTIGNQLYYIAGSVTGTASDGSTQIYGGFAGAKNIFIIGGTGAA